MKNWLTLTLGLFIFSGAYATADCTAAFEFVVDGATVYFYDASTADPGPILEWTWDFGDGTTSSEANPVHTYAEPGEYDVCLTIHSDGGCFDDKCESNIPVDGVAGDCVVTADVVAWDGTSGHFIAEVTPAADIVTYTWNWGDGGPLYSETTAGTPSDPWHTYMDPGVYTVCVTITTGAGCTDEYCFDVEVPAVGGDCNADFEYTTDGLLSHFYETATGTGDMLYSWSFGDGTISTLPNPEHMWATEGTYLVCLTIVTATGCTDTYCTEVTITLGGDCESDFEFDADGLTIHYFETANAGGGGADIISYHWNFGDGTTSDDPNPVHTYTEAGTYLVCLTIITDAGCENTFCEEIEVELPTGDCLAGFEVTSIELGPDGYIVHFNNTSTSGADITSTVWYFGDGSVGDSYDAEHVYTESGVYVVCVVISTADGCVDEYCFELVIGEEGCTSDFEFTTDGLHVNFFETADGGGTDIVSYAWDFGDGTFADGPNPEHTYTETGTYVVCLTITTASGCVSTYCYEVHVEGPEFCGAGYETEGIEETPDGWMAHFANTSIGSEIYHWNFGDGGMSELASPSHLFEAVGIYNVCLTIGVDGGDCFDTYCEELFIGGADDCVVSEMIDSTMDCIEVYEPVCGCNNVTYSNSCFAQYYGGVVYWTAGACGTTGVQEENIFGSMHVSPNPANQYMQITYHMEKNADVTIEMRSLTGQEVIVPIAHQSVAGNYNIEIPTSNLAEGIYIVRIAAEGQSQMEKIIIAH